MDASGALAAAAKSGGLLKLIYGDLARPGVRQVGKAIGTLLGIGNTVLIPLRLLNEAGRKAEERAFDKLADRFSSIPEDEVQAVPAEIGLAVLDRISATHDDALQAMYAELLASAATEGGSPNAHPSFVSMISCLSPDEAILIPQLQGSREHPFITINYRAREGIGKITHDDLIFVMFDGLTSSENIPLYVANLSGMGLIEITRNAHLNRAGAYESIYEQYKQARNPPLEILYKGAVFDLSYDRGFIAITELGKKFVAASVPRSLQID